MNIVGKKQNEAYQEFKDQSGGVAPLGSKTLNAFSNGTGAQVINYSWQSSNGCTIFFTITYHRKGGHQIQPTFIKE
jgi:hypothetical protein